MAKYSPFANYKLFAGQAAGDGGIIVNKGIINTPAPQQRECIFGQIANGENSAAYNYGIIKNQDRQCNKWSIFIPYAIYSFTKCW